MFRTIIHLIFLYLLGSPVLCVGQTILKRKDLNRQLEVVQGFIQQEEYEKAMNTFWNKEEVISPENVPKKNVDFFNDINGNLSTKRKQFQDMETSVSAYLALLQDKAYCACLDLLEFQLTKNNSFETTQRKLTATIPQVLLADKECRRNTSRVEKWESDMA
ncbi:hypothetical protein OAE48_00610, partial [Flavobacteriales bacterium]|nr:hypothetical protein [Flavobacteriales bacterium]